MNNVARLRPLSLGRLPEHQQSWTNGGALRNSQSGVDSEQLHQRRKPRPQHRLQPQPRGEPPCLTLITVTYRTILNQNSSGSRAGLCD